MGKKYTTRHASRRKVKQCSDHCDRILDHLADVSQAYTDTAKPVTAAMEELGSMTEMLKSLLLSVREKI